MNRRKALTLSAMRRPSVLKWEEHDYLSLRPQRFTLKVVETAQQLSLKGSNSQNLVWTTFTIWRAYFKMQILGAMSREADTAGMGWGQGSSIWTTVYKGFWHTPWNVLYSKFHQGQGPDSNCYFSTLWFYLSHSHYSVYVFSFLSFFFFGKPKWKVWIFPEWSRRLWARADGFGTHTRPKLGQSDALNSSPVNLV